MLFFRITAAMRSRVATVTAAVFGLALGVALISPDLARSQAGLEFGPNGKILGQVRAQGVPPVLSACGTSPALAAGSTDFAGRITVGTTATNTCTLTFSTSWGTAPACVYQNLTTGAAVNVVTVTATTIVWSSALADSTVLAYHCIGLGS